jgi:hypothetical protein
VLRGSVNGSGKADEECVCGMYSHSFMVHLGDEPPFSRGRRKDDVAIEG